ncbi:hypothetical protein F4604DRAFT_1926263 [Suillus subluteus]|nr:hypothetical protein F4604DRAFT_1926263 [Suillus subluteus]
MFDLQHPPSNGNMETKLGYEMFGLDVGECFVCVAATYSASANENVTNSCFLDPQSIAPLSMSSMKPVIACQCSWEAPSASAQLMSPLFIVPKCAQPGLLANCASIETANVMSSISFNLEDPLAADNVLVLGLLDNVPVLPIRSCLHIFDVGSSSNPNSLPNPSPDAPMPPLSSSLFLYPLHASRNDWVTISTIGQVAAVRSLILADRVLVLVYLSFTLPLRLDYPAILKWAKKAHNLPALKAVTPSHSAIPWVRKCKASAESNEGTSQDAPSIIDDAILADELKISDYRPSSDSEADSDMEAPEINDDLEELESITMFLSAEIPTFVSTSEAERHDFLLTQPTWSCTSASKLTQKTEPFLSKPAGAIKLRQTAEPFPFSSAQTRAPTASRTAEPFPFSLAQKRAPMASRTKTQFNTCGCTSAKTQSVRDHKQTNKTPVWVDDFNDMEELKAISDDQDDPESLNDNSLVPDDNDNHRGHSEEPKLVWSTNTRKLKLMHQNSETCYPDITKKNQFTQDTLLTAACTCGVTPIYNHLKANDLYASALATLALLANHVYHYAQCFDEKNDPNPQATKPYSADILPYLMKGCYFNGSKSVSVKFADHFKEIADNKAKWPEVTIPIVALTSTSVYAALLWKSSKTSSKFNFTGNQFSEVYTFHVNFLNKMEEHVPTKFHKLMADIFEAINSSQKKTLL